MTTTATAVRKVGEPKIRAALLHSVALAVASLVTYEVTTEVLSRVHSISSSDDLLGGMWAVIATVFVYRTTYQDSVSAAWSRGIATVLGFALCLVYLLITPFHPWALPTLIGLSALILLLMGRPGEVVTAGVTVVVVLVVAAISPHDAWEQPILRLVDTGIGVVIGFAAAWAAKTVDGRLRAGS
jgi:uncharacterized membrane protein YgaE (UPF0421/DUF939 family)